MTDEKPPHDPITNESFCYCWQCKLKLSEYIKKWALCELLAESDKNA